MLRGGLLDFDNAEKRVWRMGMKKGVVMKGIGLITLHAIFALYATVAPAADAVFAPSGNAVFLLREGCAWRLALKTSPTLEKLNVDAGGASLEALAMAKEGILLAVSDKNALLRVDDSGTKWSPIYQETAGQQLDDVAVNPTDGFIYLSTRVQDAKTSRMMALTLDQPRPMSVFCRRVDYVRCPVFDSSGRFYFGYQTDLWQGSIERPEGTMAEIAKEYEEAEVHMFTLIATRLAPLGTPETYAGTPSGLGVVAIAPGANRIYAHLHRIGGSGWGHIVSILNPSDKQEKDELKAYAKLLESAQTIAENGAISYLCASRDGNKVFYMDGKKQFFLEEHGHPAQKLSVKFSE